ncbi:nitrate reductase cytochrome c-type subunit [Lysobacter sp. LF1]|uniref:Periplasmic nitrate reductase, electron transfer subunit n=1 Tax=Lysobacter stagni TaxID=3045172 RepID=A0ABT6XBD7_9GAMM|nr:nitrate reductase cytochrome c-type subunit [Lysobacter sp. LF1]MDI9237458.1 nitrate reductase cytochrome c-type subunit [Lysobacter sp. LF1]
MSNAFTRNRLLWFAGGLVLAVIVLVFVAGWLAGRTTARHDEERAARAATQAAHAPAAGSALGRTDMQQIDALRRGIPVDQEAAPMPLARVENADRRRERAYPMQPPTIPHAIDGYQVDKNSNRCMLCHARANAEKFQAPPVSVTHYMDRDDQFLAAISPRRYFCNQCHVVQTDARLLVGNHFQTIDEVMAAAEAGTATAEASGKVQ